MSRSDLAELKRHDEEVLRLRVMFAEFGLLRAPALGWGGRPQCRCPRRMTVATLLRIVGMNSIVSPSTGSSPY